MEEKNYRVPDYVRRAQKKYIEKFDRITISLPQGSREKLLAIGHGRTAGAVCRDIVLQALSDEDGENAERRTDQGFTDM